MRYSVFPCSYRYIYYYKNTERENKMNNKRIIKTTSAIALLLSLSLTACGTQDLSLIHISYPSEKYGYIIPVSSDQTSMVATFKEKPTMEVAKEYIAQGCLLYTSS